jgi:putative CocE/NonD family hydrolase
MKPLFLSSLRLNAIVGGLIFLSSTAFARQGAPPAGPRFTKTETMVEMRDGTHLHTMILAPSGANSPLPLLLLRTPYGIGFGPAMVTQDYLKDLAADGYIFVFQDIRGRFKSEGRFVMSRPPRDKTDPKSIDESTDTYDTIDWLVKNIPNNNGRVGMLGISYGGWLTIMGMLDPHPALKAISPQASPADQFLGDDFHHNGAFRLSYGFEYVAMMETSKVNFAFKFDRNDTFDWYLQLGALRHVNEKYFHGKMPTWNDFIAHPNYDEFWQKQAFAPYLQRVTVPTLHVAGWWDQEDFYGELKAYELLEKHDKKNQNFLVVGPWNHGGWSHGPGQSLGKIPFGSPTAKYYRENIQAPWFAHFLKDKGKLDQPEALLFETGSNKWISYPEWPPRQAITMRPLYLRSGGRLSFDLPPASSDPFDSYVSDPANPVPYRPRPIEPTYPGPGWPVWEVQNQRFAQERADVLSYETDPLLEDVTIAGDLGTELFAATTGSDSDWIVKLIDVYPDNNPKAGALSGYELMVSGEVLRGRFRHGFTKPEAIVPGKVEKYAVGLHWRDHCFQKGHKIMVQVQSTWFPVIDRNPQKFVDNIFEAGDADYQKATQRIYRSGEQASHILLPIKQDTSRKDPKEESRGLR